jgi:CheY-like chemotaxis protein
MKDRRPILLLEDDEIDVTAIQRALKELNIKNPLVVCENGAQGLEWLRANLSTPPAVILTDIDMPVMNGLEFLAQVKQDPDLQKFPVVILSTFREEKDRANAFKLGVSGYMIKPIDAAKYLSIMKTIADYWQSSELPA